VSISKQSTTIEKT